MKSKQQRNKEAQGYIEKPVQRICINCKHMHIERIFPDPEYPGWYKDSDTCVIGDFKVKRQATCHFFEIKTDLS